MQGPEKASWRFLAGKRTSLQRWPSSGLQPLNGPSAESRTELPDTPERLQTADRLTVFPPLPGLQRIDYLIKAF